jgi:hypothetical protein
MQQKISLDELEQKMDKIERRTLRYQGLVDEKAWKTDPRYVSFPEDYSGLENRRAFLSFVRDIAWETAELVTREIDIPDPMRDDLVESEYEELERAADVLRRFQHLEKEVLVSGADLDEDYNLRPYSELPNEEYSLGWVYTQYLDGKMSQDDVQEDLLEELDLPTDVDEI